MLPSLIVNGILLGAYYALAGVGLVVIYGASDVLNFAQGDMATLMTFVAFTLIVTLHVPYGPAFVLVVILGGVLGWLIYSLVLRRMRGASQLECTIATLGVAMILNGATVDLWGRSSEPFPTAIAGQAFALFGVGVSWQAVVGLLVATLTIGALAWFFSRTVAGSAFRAVSQNPEAARTIGLSTTAVGASAWALAGALAALAGMLIAPLTFLDAGSLDALMIWAFVVVVFGGLRSFTGAIVAGIAVGIVENLISGYASADLRDTTIFAIMLVVLALRPGGLFATPEMQKV